MSYMSPSYIQMDLNASWTSSYLANRYRLLLYREVGWDPNNEVSLFFLGLFWGGRLTFEMVLKNLFSYEVCQCYSYRATQDLHIKYAL